MSPKKNNNYKIILLLGFFIYFLFSLKEIGNFYQTGHAGFINAEVGLSHINMINNGFLKTKLGATNYKVIYNRAPTEDEYYVRYPYLHNLLISILWKITGPNEIAARLFTIILVFGSLTVIYYLSREFEYSKLFSALVYFTLCSFPIFFHYARLSNGEISTLLPLLLSYYFYLKFQKKDKSKYKFLFLISLSVSCQLFWYGYIVAFVFFIDSLFVFFHHKQKKDLMLSFALILTVFANIAIFIFHTLWLVGSLEKVVQAFLWRTSVKVPQTQCFTLIDFIIKNLKRWWLFNPVVILFALVYFHSPVKRKNQNDRFLLDKRVNWMLLIAPLIFILSLSHLVHYHDFLIIYFAFFLAFSSVGLFLKIYKKTHEKLKNVFILSYIFILIFFAVFGLVKNPEEKMIDKKTDNYELYYILKVIRNNSAPEDRFILTLRRDDEPQVKFYLRREAFFMTNPPKAKGFIESNEFSFYLVEDKLIYRPLIKYLLENYRCQKYNRYYLFNLKKPGKGLRIFRRIKRKTNFLFKYFVSPWHQPGGYRKIKDRKAIEKIYDRFEEVENMYSNP